MVKLMIEINQDCLANWFTKVGQSIGVALLIGIPRLANQLGLAC